MKKQGPPPWGIYTTGNCEEGGFTVTGIRLLSRSVRAARRLYSLPCGVRPRAHGARHLLAGGRAHQFD
jgi:hypothetical protein